MNPIPVHSPARAVRYANLYTWLVFIAAMDVLMTFLVLVDGGREMNTVAAPIIRHFGVPGMTFFKFALVSVVILLCESIGRRNLQAGYRFALLAVAITSLPVLISFGLLLTRGYR